jgi:hypothetical protein
MPTFAMSVCVLLLQDFAIQPRRPNLTILPHIFTGRRMNEEHHCNAQEHLPWGISILRCTPRWMHPSVVQSAQWVAFWRIDLRRDSTIGSRLETVERNGRHDWTRTSDLYRVKSRTRPR